MACERVNPEGFNSLTGKFPIGQQLFTMQINPHLNHAQLRRGKSPGSKVAPSMSTDVLNNERECVADDIFT